MSFSNSDKTTEFYHGLSSKQSQQLLTQEKDFDYAVLSPQVRILVQSKTSELKSLMRRSAQDLIDIGQKLTEVKEQLGHGNFGVWLKAEFDWSVRTAGRFMQVATQFKSAELANLNIAVSALYLLAEPSTPQKARQQALELAKKGENITFNKAKAIVKAKEGNSFTPSQPCQSQNTHSQLEPKDEANSATIEWEKRLEQKAIEKIDSVPKQYLEVPAQLQPEHSNHVRVLNIEHQNPKLVTNIAQTFELTYAGVRINVEGNPEALTILFEQMQKNSAFTEKVLQEAKLMAANKQQLGLLLMHNT
ncbi:DUF3102 domain-containing protein [Scytonema sp. UIC 10036]|uniref:DUF3102 domain-containing protein n=1 Tax=Scytonema sp. UIC 10036 TaxID=2304196 RepID=UPI0012DAB66A|nr:DUF3102 domain-containing protein [Scytonema sp. UIC 10036]MUG96556.1 DUF3102 domain-containing protein [Scytonema sp. UIC 10036]